MATMTTSSSMEQQHAHAQHHPSLPHTHSQFSSAVDNVAANAVASHSQHHHYPPGYSSSTGSEGMDNYTVPNEADLVLLCLDYLRDLRRAYSIDLLQQQEGLQADYLTMACWALQRAFSPEHLPNLTDPEQGNDCWQPADPSSTSSSKKQQQQYGTPSRRSSTPTTTTFPSLKEMEREILYNQENDSHHANHHYNSTHGDQKKEQDPEDDYNNGPPSSYEYNDNHVSNAHRFYGLGGLASGPTLPGPLTLGEVCAAGLVGLQGRTRWQAEQEMLATPLFEQFVAAVKAKGFFDTVLPESGGTPEHGGSRHHHRRGSSSASEKAAAAAQQAQALYEERFRKVVAKFRVKLAHKAMMAAAAGTTATGTSSSVAGSLSQAAPQDGEEMTTSTAGGNGLAPGGGGADWMALMAADQQRKRRESRLSINSTTPASTPGTPRSVADEHEGRYSSGHPPLHHRANVDEASHVGSNVDTELSAASYVKRTAFAQRLFADASSDQHSVVTSSSAQQALLLETAGQNPDDLEEAERLKLQGNSFMKQKEYSKAADCYTAALKLSPAGPQAHVYYSNRAAALVSLRKFSKAILDSERSLSLKPDYGKAHARLGLAHFLLGNYRQAIAAYTTALKYEPDNKSSKSYLEKATKRLAETNSKQQQQPSSASSVSSATNNKGEVTGKPPKKSGGGRESSPSSRAESHYSHHSSHHSSHASPGHRRSSPNASHSSVIRDEKEAEKYKTKGNALMANREYSTALEAYNQAIRLSPEGPQSHVYYSNRAAALCYLERYKEAEEDSIQSLRFDPTYGKAHARLGLSRFFLQKYAGAVEAYTDALKYDPDNSASRSYLQKAKAKLNAEQAERNMPQVSPLSESTARRLMTDESVRIMTQRALQDPSRDLLHDPEMKRLSKKAMAALRK